jgi:hypothetical protein
MRERILAELGRRGPGLRPARHGIAPRTWWVSFGLAASMIIAVGVGVEFKSHQERAAGLEARRQVIEALRVTHEKLDLAYQAVRDQSS